MPVVTDREVDEIAMHLRTAAQLFEDLGNQEGIDEVEAALDLLGVPRGEAE